MSMMQCIPWWSCSCKIHLLIKSIEIIIRYASAWHWTPWTSALKSRIDVSMKWICTINHFHLEQIVTLQTCLYYIFLQKSSKVKSLLNGRNRVKQLFNKYVITAKSNCSLTLPKLLMYYCFTKSLIRQCVWFTIRCILVQLLATIL